MISVLWKQDFAILGNLDDNHTTQFYGTLICRPFLSSGVLSWKPTENLMKFMSLLVLLLVYSSDIEVKSKLVWYCWWKKSRTSRYGKYPIIFRILYIPGGAGFVPSTVWILMNPTKDFMKWHGPEFEQLRNNSPPKNYVVIRGYSWLVFMTGSLHRWCVIHFPLM